VTVLANFEIHALIVPDVLDDGACPASLADASLDYVVVNHMHQHVEDPIAALEHQRRSHFLHSKRRGAHRRSRQSRSRLDLWVWRSGFLAHEELEFGIDWLAACLVQSARERFIRVIGAEVPAQQRMKLRAEERASRQRRAVLPGCAVSEDVHVLHERWGQLDVTGFDAQSDRRGCRGQRAVWQAVDDQDKDMSRRVALSSGCDIVRAGWSCRGDSQPNSRAMKGKRCKSEVELRGDRDLCVVNPCLRLGDGKCEPEDYGNNEARPAHVRSICRALTICNHIQSHVRPRNAACRSLRNSRHPTVVRRLLCSRPAGPQPVRSLSEIVDADMANGQSIMTRIVRYGAGQWARSFQNKLIPRNTQQVKGFTLLIVSLRSTASAPDSLQHLHTVMASPYALRS
jgi:hypothetical protein